jgi:hypothetical protein
MKLSMTIASAIISSLVWTSPGRAGQEIADLTKIGADRRGPTDVLLASGSNPIGAEAFVDYVPPQGYLKNTERMAEFNDQETLSSPDKPEPEVTYVTTPDGYTWTFIARIRSFMWPFRAAQYADMEPSPQTGWEAAAFVPTPLKGTVRYSANTKNQIMYFWAREGNVATGAPIKRYFITDRWGNRYIMMASGALNAADKDAAFKAAVLPAGWRKSTGRLSKTLAAMPAHDNDGAAQYNIFRDSGDNSYVQIGWGKHGVSIAQQIGDTMPIWGGRAGDYLRGTNGNDIIHGAEGNDTIVTGLGDDVVFGDGGKANTAILPGRVVSYRMEEVNADVITLTGRHGRKQLDHIQRIQFADGLCWASMIRASAKRSPGGVPCRP